MKDLVIKKYLPVNHPIAYGCMGLGGSWSHDPYTEDEVKQAHAVVDVALESGINFFDHADIYTLGKAEQVFGRVLKERPGLREEIVIQSKCGIRFESEGRPKCFDFSKEWILSSVDGILKRLGIEHIDALLLHRPDPLMEPEEVAEVFAQLHASGKVGFFGVSNMAAYQIAFLQSAIDQPLIANQIELSLAHLTPVEEGVTNGCSGLPPLNFNGGTLQHCKLNDIQIQTWGSLARGLFTGKDISNESDSVKATAGIVASIANQLQVSREAVVLAWILRLPYSIQPVIGTTHHDRIRACAEAVKVALTREQWYTIYNTARSEELP
jgi:predicted oxidoreductase